MDAVIQLEFGDYTAVFRTSEEVRGVGFDMYTVCFRPAEESLEGELMIRMSTFSPLGGKDLSCAAYHVLAVYL